MIVFDRETLNFNWEGPEQLPRIAGYRRISLLRRPLTEKALGGFTLRFVKEQIELAASGVGIQLVIPSLLFPRAKPVDDAPVFCWGQTVDRSLDLLNAAHVWSLSGHVRFIVAS